MRQKKSERGQGPARQVTNPPREEWSGVKDVERRAKSICRGLREGEVTQKVKK